MKLVALLVGLLLVYQSVPTIAKQESFRSKLLHGANGGYNCVICTALVALTEQLAIVYNETVDDSIEKLCNFLPNGIFKLTCKEAIIEFGPIIISG